jgi:hypothetical protein
VSRTHAALRRQGAAVYVQDLGSSCGTFVGGTAVTGPRELHPGDVVSFASVRARFEPASAAAEDTLIGGDPVPALPAATPDPGHIPAARDYAARDPVHTVAAPDPGHTYAAPDPVHTYAARDPVYTCAAPDPGHTLAFAAPGVRCRPEASATRSKARWFSLTGLVVMAEGFAVAAITKASLGGHHGVVRGGLAQLRLGPSLAGVPSGLAGWALAGTGFLLLVAGIGLHIAADRER